MSGVAALGALALLLGGGVSAQAITLPTPDEGSYGTQVTLTPPYPSDFTQISSYDDHTLAIGADGYTWAWGENTDGGLGDGTTTHRSTPVLVKTPAGVTFTQVSAGTNFSVALGSDGNAYAWGRNQFGELGVGDTNSRSLPTRVSLPAGVTLTALSAGSSHVAGLGSDGEVYMWGRNYQGRLGFGDGVDRWAPDRLASVPAGVTFTKLFAGSEYTLAIADNGEAFAWGANGVGQLGVGDTVAHTAPTPIKMPSGVLFTQFTVGFSTAFAIGDNGKTYAWGASIYGALGFGDTASRSSPTLLPTLGGVAFTEIVAGGTFTLAIGGDGKTYSWGSNYHGQLGNGTNNDRSVPGLVSLPSGVKFTSVLTGSTHSFAFGDNGRLYSWGANPQGQLGNGNTTNRNTSGLVTIPAVTVTGATFGGTAGTAITNLGSGKWRVTAPKRNGVTGPVDIVMNWTLGGVTQTPITYTEGFTYLPPEVEITARAYRDTNRTIEIAEGSMLAPGMTTLYWEYTIKNTGPVPISITELTRDAELLAPGTACLTVELAVNTSTTCRAQSTV